MMDVVSPPRSPRKNNPNHDEHGRFSAGEGGGEDHDEEGGAAPEWTDEEEAHYSAEQGKLAEKTQAIGDTKAEIAASVKKIQGLHDKLGKHAEALTEHHDAVESASVDELTALKVSKAGEDTRAQIADEAKNLAKMHTRLGDHLDAADEHLAAINQMLDDHDNANEEESDAHANGRELHDALDQYVLGKDTKEALKKSHDHAAPPTFISKAALMSFVKTKPMRKAFGASTETLADRQVRVVISTGQIDRSGDVVVQSGIGVANFKASRTVLWNHDHDHPVASCLEIGLDDGRLSALVQFPPEGTTRKADEVYGLIKSGVVNAASIGFLPLDVEPVDGRNPRKGLRIESSDLLEFSFVSVPANPGAQVLERRMVSKSTRGLSRRKGLFAVENLAGLVQDLGAVVDQAADERMREGDASSVPDQLKDCLRQLGAALIAMTSEEVAELIGDPDEDTIDSGSVDPTTPMLTGLKTLVGLVKYGRVISAANAATLRAHLGAIGDAHQAMVKMIDEADDPLDDQARAASENNQARAASEKTPRAASENNQTRAASGNSQPRAASQARAASGKASRAREIETLALAASV